MSREFMDSIINAAIYLAIFVVPILSCIALYRYRWKIWIPAIVCIAIEAGITLKISLDYLPSNSFIEAVKWALRHPYDIFTARLMPLFNMWFILCAVVTCLVRYIIKKNHA